MMGEGVAQGLDVWAPGLVCSTLFCLCDLPWVVGPASEPSCAQGVHSLRLSLLPGTGLASGPVLGAHPLWVVLTLCCRCDCSCFTDGNSEAPGRLTWGCSPDLSPGSPTLMPSALCPALGAEASRYQPGPTDEAHLALLLFRSWGDGASARREPSVGSRVIGALELSLPACVNLGWNFPSLP